VIFDIDANGILNVTAKDKGTGKEQSISITGASTLSDDEVSRMVRDAEVNADADRERREQIETKNQADSLVYQTEKQLQELGDKVPGESKTKIEGLIKDLKEAVAKEDYEKMKSLTSELQQELYSVGSAVYQQEAAAAGVPDMGVPTGEAPGAAPSGGAASGGDDDVIDAEFSETK